MDACAQDLKKLRLISSPHAQLHQNEHGPADILFRAWILFGKLGIRRIFTNFFKAESGSQRSHHDVSKLVRQAAGLNHFSRCRISESSLTTAEKHCRMHCGHDGAACGSDNSISFNKEAGQIGQVFQNQTTNDEIERLIREREGVTQIVMEELDTCRSLLPRRLSQHTFGKVDCRHICTGRRKPQGMATGPAAKIKHGEVSNVAGCFLDEWFLQCWEWVPVMIINAGPTVVTVTNRAEPIRLCGIRQCSFSN